MSTTDLKSIAVAQRLIQFQSTVFAGTAVGEAEDTLELAGQLAEHAAQASLQLAFDEHCAHRIATRALACAAKAYLLNAEQLGIDVEPPVIPPAIARRPFTRRERLRSIVADVVGLIKG